MRVREGRRDGVQASGGLQLGGGKEEEEEEEKEEEEEEEGKQRLAARRVCLRGLCLNPKH